MKSLLPITTIILVSMTTLLAEDISQKIENESFVYNQKIKILQEADKCIKNADSQVEYKECKSQEKEAKKALKSKRKNVSISEAKEKALSKIDKRITKLLSTKKCIEQADTKEELKACKKDKSKKSKKD